MQATYRRYYKLNLLGGTVLAGNATLGLSNVFNPRDRDDTGTIDEIDLTLPISELLSAARLLCAVLASKKPVRTGPDSCWYVH